MGHFETFQVSLFAGAFDHSIHLKDFDIKAVCKKLGGDRDLHLDPARLAAHRGSSVDSIGMIIAESLKGWHDPRKVNNHFRNLYMRKNFFSEEDISRLEVLWQFRHSIVHTGGTLTAGDAQKIKRLRNFGETNIAFDSSFISEVSRKFHTLIFESVERARSDFTSRTKENLPPQTAKEIQNFFEVTSKTTAWLPARG